MNKIEIGEKKKESINTIIKHQLIRNVPYVTCMMMSDEENEHDDDGLALAAKAEEDNALYNPSYYHCYCLRSLDTKHPYKNYVGFVLF